jgi:hypothetical protein
MKDQAHPVEPSTTSASLVHLNKASELFLDEIMFVISDRGEKLCE